MIHGLNQERSLFGQDPIGLWQDPEKIPIYGGHCIEDLTALAVAHWEQLGVRGAFNNLVGSGRNCGSYVCEIKPRGERRPQRCLYEQLMYVVKGRGATTVWNDGSK